MKDPLNDSRKFAEPSATDEIIPQKRDPAQSAGNNSGFFLTPRSPGPLILDTN